MRQTCSRCGKPLTDDDRFCPKCGLDQTTVQREESRADEKPCPRHPKEMTALACGRCGTPVCTKCVILGPAGPRCRDCAKTNVGFRPAAILLEGKRTFLNLFNASPWIATILIISLLGFLGRGCQMMMDSRQRTNFESNESEPAPVDSTNAE